MAYGDDYAGIASSQTIDAEHVKDLYDELSGASLADGDPSGSFDSVAARLDAIQSVTLGDHVILVDEQAGADDDARWNAAVAAFEAQSASGVRSIIQFGPGTYTLTSSAAQTITDDGLRVRGFRAWHDMRGGGSDAYVTRITINMGDPDIPWITFDGNTYGHNFEHLYFISSDGDTRLFGRNDTGAQITTSRFHNIATNAVLSVCGGNSGLQFSMQACEFSGWWNVNNCQDTAFWLGGSDNFMWSSGTLLLDSPTGNAPAANTPHIEGSYLAKTTFGNMYITAEGPWQAMRFNGPSANAHGIKVFGSMIEGRNAGAACDHPLIEIDNHHGGGGNVGLSLIGCWLGYVETGVRGMIDIDDGVVATVSLHGCSMGHATGATDDDPPLMYIGTGSAGYCYGLQVEDGPSNVPEIVDNGAVRAVTDGSAVVVGPPSTLIVNTAEQGSDGTTVTTGNSGGGGDQAWVDVTGSNIEFDDAQAMNGSLSYLLASTTSTSESLGWDVQSSQLATVRFYIRLNAGVPDWSRLVRFRNAGDSAQYAGLTLNADERISVRDSSESIVATTTNALSTGTWYRVEFAANTVTGYYDLSVRVGDAAGEDADLSLGGTGATFSSGNIGHIVFGRDGGGAGTYPDIWLDDLAADVGITTLLGAST